MVWFVKGCGMDPWLVLVSPCFRENIVVTCKIGPFVCSLDNLPQRNVIVLFFGNQISKWRSFEKRAIFDLLFTFSSHQGKGTKIPSTHYLKHIHTYTYFAHPIDFFALPILKKYEFIRYSFSLVWVLVLILIRAILRQSINNKMVSKFKLECLLLIYILTLMKKFKVFCKPRTLNDGVKIQWNTEIAKSTAKYRFLAAAILLFIDKIFITRWPPWVNLKLFVLM